ncbi:DUF3574 domain-containing protein [Pantoea stewartii]|uniref:DUF3574 domain-containing protein n=1 Tax=Pantoea stewartii TaxID=66269 RepID=UPI0025A0A66C|nr:DUF3574 domain-containing protein [Pantoea stewartii]
MTNLSAARFTLQKGGRIQILLSTVVPAKTSYIDKDGTPRFSAGLSFYDAQEQRPGGNGQSVRDKSRALVLIYQFNMESNRRVEALRALCKNQFGQDSVTRVDTPACISF